MGRRNYERGSAARRPRLIILVLRLYRTASRVSCGRKPKTPLFTRPPSYTFLLCFRGRRTRGRIRVSLARRGKVPRGEVSGSSSRGYLNYSRLRPQDAWPDTVHHCRRTCLQQRLRVSTLVLGPQVHNGSSGNAATRGQKASRGEHASLARHGPWNFRSSAERPRPSPFPPPPLGSNDMATWAIMSSPHDEVPIGP